MSKESLGVVSCEGCNGDAHIKRRSNGKKLLYLHCKNCGLDQRSGKHLQAKWQAAIDGGSVEQSQVGTTPKINNDEWQPAEDSKNEITDTNENENSNSSGNGFKWLAGIVTTIVCIAGLRAS